MNGKKIGYIDIKKRKRTNSRKISLLTDALVEIDDKDSLDKEKRASDVIKSINDLRVFQRVLFSYGKVKKCCLS